MATVRIQPLDEPLQRFIDRQDLQGRLQYVSPKWRDIFGTDPAGARAVAREIDAAGRVVMDFDLATPMLLIKLFPEGMLGLGLQLAGA